MSMLEVVETLTDSVEEIDPKTRKQSLAVVIPMIEDGLKGNLVVLDALIADDKERFGRTQEGTTAWKNHCDHLKELVKKGKEILTSPTE